jgi:hypothetical protein
MIRDNEREEAFYETYSIMRLTQIYLRDINKVVYVPSELRPLLLKAIVGVWTEYMKALGEVDGEEYAFYLALKKTFKQEFLDTYVKEISILDTHKGIVSYIKSRILRATRPG